MSGGWVKDHKKELLAAAAVAGVGAATGGFGLLAAPAAEGAVAGGLLESGFAGIGGASEAAGGGLLGGMSGLGTGLERAGKIAQLSQLGGLGQQQPNMPPPQMPQGVQPVVNSQIPSMAQSYPVDVIDPEKRRRMMMRGGYG